MIKANLAVGLVAAGMLALVLGVFLYTLGPGPMREATSPGGGTAGVGGAADAPAGTAPAAGGAAAGFPAPDQPAARPPGPPAAPAGPVVGTGGGVRSGATGGPVVTDPVGACAPNLLQTMLGLVTATLGGRGAC